IERMIFIDDFDLFHMLILLLVCACVLAASWLIAIVHSSTLFCGPIRSVQLFVDCLRGAVLPHLLAISLSLSQLLRRMVHRSFFHHFTHLLSVLIMFNCFASYQFSHIGHDEPERCKRKPRPLLDGQQEDGLPPLEERNSKPTESDQHINITCHLTCSPSLLADQPHIYDDANADQTGIYIDGVVSIERIVEGYAPWQIRLQTIIPEQAPRDRPD